MNTCTECGRKVLTKSDRCSYCRNRKESDLGLPPGRWVRNGLTLRFEPLGGGQVEEWTGRPDRADMCACGNAKDVRAARCRGCYTADAKAASGPPRKRKESTHPCVDCGGPATRRRPRCRRCYVADSRGENRQWAEKEAVEASWRAATEHYKPRQVALKEVA